LFASAVRVIPLAFVSALAPEAASRSGRSRGTLPAPGLGCRPPGISGSLHVDASRISQVSRRSILCLCSAPRPRSNRRALAIAVTSMLPHACTTARASDDDHFGAHSRSFSTCSPTLRVSCCHLRARLASGWLAGLYREGVEPSGSLRKVSDHMIILLSCPPDAKYIDFMARIISLSPVELVGPGVNDRVLIEVIHGGDDTILEFLFGFDADVAQH
jgi:hypothetical protein